MVLPKYCSILYYDTGTTHILLNPVLYYWYYSHAAHFCTILLLLLTCCSILYYTTDTTHMLLNPVLYYWYYSDVAQSCTILLVLLTCCSILAGMSGSFISQFDSWLSVLAGCLYSRLSLTDEDTWLVWHVSGDSVRAGYKCPVSGDPIGPT